MRRLVLLLALAALTIPCSAGAWTWPVEGPVLRPFAFGTDPYAGGQHRGVDIGAPLGALVAAPAAGTVSFTGSVPGGGHAITIRTSDGYSVTLLQLGAIGVLRGSVVAEGAAVGTVGESVDAVTHESHVHLGIRYTENENGYVDPLSLLPPRIVVLPPLPDAPSLPAETGGAPSPAAPTAEANASEAADEHAQTPPNAQPEASDSPTPTATGADVASETEPAAVEETQIRAEPVAPAPPTAELPAPIASTADTAPDPSLEEPAVAPTPPAAPAVPEPALDPTAVSLSAETTIQSPGPPPAPLLVALLPLPPLALPARASAPVTAVATTGSAASSTGRLAEPTAFAPALRAVPGQDAKPLIASRRSRRELPSAAAAARTDGPSGGERTLVLASLLGAAALAACAVARPGSRKRPRIMETDGELSGEDLRRGRVAVRRRTEAHRPRGGLRRPVRRVRPLPAAARERRPDGERDRRARDARHGHRRSRGRVSA